MEIDFDTINAEIETSEVFALEKVEETLTACIDLDHFVKSSHDYEVKDRESAQQCLSMSLQARKMRQALDKTRAEIVRPHFDFQRAVNKLSRSFENTLEEIEKLLTFKINKWLEKNKEAEPAEIINHGMKVEDGSLSKKQTWHFEIEKEDIVPREFLSIDEKKIQLAIKNGVRNIEGVRIYEKMELDLRVKNK